MVDYMKDKLAKLVHRVVVESRGDPSQVDRLVRTHVTRLKIKELKVKQKFENEAKSRAITEVQREKKHKHKHYGAQ